MFPFKIFKNFRNCFQKKNKKTIRLEAETAESIFITNARQVVCIRAVIGIKAQNIQILCIGKNASGD